MGGPCTVDEKVRQELDNFHTCQVLMDGILWMSSEQCYQAMKFPHDDAAREAVRQASPGMGSWSAGQKAKARPDLEEVKVDMMYEANWAKFSQNDHLRQVLVESVGPIHAQGGFWKTWNEVLLERIREELRGDNSRDSFVLSQRKAAMAAYRTAARNKDEVALTVATKYAAKRQLAPDLSSLSKLTVQGVDENLDGLYTVDLLEPEANGQVHYSCKTAGHLFVGVKNGRRAWVLDDSFEPFESTGAAFMEALPDSSIPFGKHMWQCYDGKSFAQRAVEIEKTRGHWTGQLASVRI